MSNIRYGSFSGGLLALATLPVHVLLPQPASELFAALLLAGIAGVYVGFAASDGRVSAIAIESTACLGFIGAAAFSLTLAPLVLPGLYVAHGAWDLAHHRTELPMPGWYVPLCLVYDVIVGAALWGLWIF